MGLPTDKQTPSTCKRAIEFRKGNESMSQNFAKRQVRDDLNSRNGPNASDIHKKPISSPIIVYCPKKDKWGGPYSLLYINGKDIIALLTPPSGPTKFCSTVVKPFVEEQV